MSLDLRNLSLIRHEAVQNIQKQSETIGIKNKNNNRTQTSKDSFEILQV